MYITDPFQFSAASYRLMGAMFEQQIRVMTVLGEAAMSANPIFAKVPARAASKPASKQTAPKPVTRLAKPAATTKPATSKSATPRSATPKSATPKQARQPSAPPAFPPAPAGQAAAHAAE